MGFFSWVSNAISSAVNYAREKIEDIIYPIREVVRKIVEGIAGTKSYNKDTASLSETAKISEILAKFSLSYKKKADELEEDCLKEAAVWFDSTINELERNNMGINTNRLRKNMDNIKGMVRGSISNHLAKKVSLDNPKCLEILKLPPGQNKDKAMNDFCKSVIREALDNLSESILKIVKDQNSEIKEFLEDKLSAKEKDLKNFEKQCAKTENLLSQDAEAKITAIIDPICLITVSDFMIYSLTQPKTSQNV